jgi:hypothetical protein
MWHPHDDLEIIASHQFSSHPHCFQHVNPLPQLLHLSFYISVIKSSASAYCLFVSSSHCFTLFLNMFCICIYCSFTTHCQLLYHLHLFISLYSLLLYLPSFLLLLLCSNLYLNVHLATTSCLVSLFSKPCPSQFTVFHAVQFPTAGADSCFYTKKISHGCVI